MRQVTRGSSVAACMHHWRQCMLSGVVGRTRCVPEKNRNQDIIMQRTTRWAASQCTFLTAAVPSAASLALRSSCSFSWSMIHLRLRLLNPRAGAPPFVHSDLTVAAADAAAGFPLGSDMLRSQANHRRLCTYRSGCPPTRAKFRRQSPRPTSVGGGQPWPPRTLCAWPLSFRASPEKAGPSPQHRDSGPTTDPGCRLSGCEKIQRQRSVEAGSQKDVVQQTHRCTLL